MNDEDLSPVGSERTRNHAAAFLQDWRFRIWSDSAPVTTLARRCPRARRQAALETRQSARTQATDVCSKGKARHLPAHGGITITA